MNKTSDIESKLQKHRDDFGEWIRRNYPGKEIDLATVDSPSYLRWKEIETDIAELFNDHKVQNLNTKGIDNLLYLIGRNWDIGSIISWLNPNNKKFSNLGHLNEESFYFLSEESVNYDDEETQSQFASSFKKFDTLNKRRENILLALYNRPGIYTKRCSLSSLYKLKYPKIESLITDAWSLNNEWLKHTCLELMIENNYEQMESYIDKAREENNELLMDLINRKIDNR